MTLFLVGVLLLAGCAGLFFDEPTITLKEIHVRQLSLTDASLVFVGEIQNPNRYELRLKSLDYTVYLNDRETGGGSLQKEISVPAS
jgi:LEA14-like dessication related protein